MKHFWRDINIIRTLSPLVFTNMYNSFHLFPCVDKGDTLRIIILHEKNHDLIMFSIRC